MGLSNPILGAIKATLDALTNPLRGPQLPIDSVSVTMATGEALDISDGSTLTIDGSLVLAPSTDDLRRAAEVEVKAVICTTTAATVVLPATVDRKHAIPFFSVQSSLGAAEVLATIKDSSGKVLAIVPCTVAGSGQANALAYPIRGGLGQSIVCELSAASTVIVTTHHWKEDSNGAPV